MELLIIISLYAFVSITYGQTISECPLGWTQFEKNCYLFSLYPELSYEEADKTCLGNGAGLVSVNSDEENTFLQTNIQSNSYQGNSIWYTSGTYYDNRLKWDGDGTYWVDYDQYWVNPAVKTTTGRGMRIIYKYSYTESKYKWDKVTEELLGRYICEIPLAEAVLLTEARRDFTYGSNFSDNSIAPHGPIMTIQPQNLVVTSRSIEPSLECVSTGIPQPKYTWYKEVDRTRTEIPVSAHFTITNGKVTFLNVSTESAYSGYYQCKAENEFGSILSNKVRITHGFMNEFSNVIPGRYNVSLYKGTYLNCRPPNYRPAAHFQWQKGSEFLQTSLNQYYFLSNDGNLYFSEVQAQDSGDYHCLVTLASQQDETMWTSQPPSTTSKGIYLNVTGQTAADFPPEIQDAFPRVFPVTPMRGQKIEIECLAYGRMPLEYSWQRVGKPMPAKVEFKDLNRVLVIKDAQFVDEGTYECHVRSTKGYDQKQFTFSLSATPYFIHPLQNMHVDINSQLTWRCEAVARPRAEFAWYKNSVPITSQPGKIEINSNVLKLSNLQPGDSGMYQCSATNTFGSVFSGAQLRVLSFKPTFHKSPLPSITLAAVNGNITIACNPQAAPAPIITWLRNGAAMSISNTDTPQGPQLLSNGDLKIARVQKADMGLYTCRAENENGRAETTTNLTVADEMVWTHTPKQITEVRWNDTQFIRCEVAYNFDKYDLIYVWKFNGRMIDFDTEPYYIKTRLQNSNGLLVRYAQFKHDGVYECIATTTVTSLSASGKLTVLGPPGEPAGVYAVKGTATPYSILLRWNSAPSRGTPVLTYTIEAKTTFNPVWRKVGEVSDVDATYVPTDQTDANTRRQFTVGGLMPYNNYTFRIYAKNSFPMPGYISIPSKSYTLPMARPEFPVSKVSGGGGTFGALTMTWKPLTMEQEGGPDIRYYAYWRKKGTTSVFQRSDPIFNRKGVFVTTLTQNDYYLQYEIIIGVENRAGFGPNSTIAVIYSAEGIPPHPPTGVSGGAINGTALLVTWNPMQNTREIIHGTIQGFEINVVDLNDPNRKSVTAYHYGVLSSGNVIGLEPNADFWVTVQVFNTAGESFPSEQTRMSTNAEPPRHYPQYVYVRSHGPDSVYVKWRGVLVGINEEVLIGYKLRWYPANDNIKMAKDVVINSRRTEGIIYGIEKRIVYKLRVLGYSNGGDGKMSPVTYFTLGGQGVPVTDPAVTALVAASESLTLSVSTIFVSLLCSFIRYF